MSNRNNNKFSHGYSDFEFYGSLRYYAINYFVVAPASQYCRWKPKRLTASWLCIAEGIRWCSSTLAGDILITFYVGKHIFVWALSLRFAGALGPCSRRHQPALSGNGKVESAGSRYNAGPCLWQYISPGFSLRWKTFHIVSLSLWWPSGSERRSVM